jgi:hypothetical protein
VGDNSNSFRFFVKQFEQESVIQGMKKIISISLTFLLLTALFHFSIATHYCGGTIAATKISLSGKLASCGMTNDEDNTPLSGTYFVSHCCENHLTFCSVTSNYQPTFSYVPEVYRDHIKILSIPEGSTLQSAVLASPICTNVSPPGELVSTNVDLSDICVYRL